MLLALEPSADEPLSYYISNRFSIETVSKLRSALSFQKFRSFNLLFEFSLAETIASRESLPRNSVPLSYSHRTTLVELLSYNDSRR